MNWNWKFTFNRWYLVSKTNDERKFLIFSARNCANIKCWEKEELKFVAPNRATESRFAGVRTISRNVDDKTKRQNEQRFLFNVVAVGVETKGVRKPWFQPRGVSQVKQPTAVSSTCRVSYSAAKLWIQIRCANLLDVEITSLRNCAFVTQPHRQRSRVSSTHKHVFLDRSLGCSILRRCYAFLCSVNRAAHSLDVFIRETLCAMVFK